MYNVFTKICRYGNSWEVTSLEAGYYAYLMFQHSLKNDDGSPKHAGTTLRSKFSMIKKYFSLIHHVDLLDTMPQISDRLKEYEKQQNSVIKACTFSVQELVLMMNLPDTPELLVFKAYFVIAKAMAARGCEVHSLEKSDVSF